MGRLVDLISKVKTDKDQKYKDYHNFCRPLYQIHSYQYLAMLRGEKEKAIKISFAIRGTNNILTNSKKANDEDCDILFDKILLKASGYNNVKYPKTSEKREALKKARSRLRKMGERMWRRQLKEMAEEDAVVTFSGNLHQKMLTPPLRFWMSEIENARFGYCEDESRIIALDPGFAHGTKVAVIKTSDGKVLGTYTLNMRQRDEAVSVLRSILWDKKSVNSSDVIAVGNGHGSQQAIQILKEAISDNKTDIRNIIYVDEAGASIYSGKYNVSMCFQRIF